MKKLLIFSLIFSACSTIENDDFGDGGGTETGGSGEETADSGDVDEMGIMPDMGVELPYCEVIYQPKCDKEQAGQCPGACILDENAKPFCVENGVEEDCICESGHADGKQMICEGGEQICVSDGLDAAECLDVGACPVPNQGLGCPCDPVEAEGYCFDGYTCLEMEGGHFCGQP